MTTATTAIPSRTHLGGADQAARRPAYQVLADDLCGQIVSGRLQPGQRLPTEPQLCSRFGLSRSTVREALRLLASQQLIVTTRGVTGGSFVVEPSPERLGDSLAMAVQLLRAAAAVDEEKFIEMREVVEVPGAAMAAQRRTDADLTALREALLDPADPDLDAKLSAYWRFHFAVAVAVHNPLFELLARPLRQLSDDRELVTRGPAELWDRAASDAGRVLGCVEAGDPAGAADATRSHLDYLRGVYRDAERRLAD